VVSVGAGDLMSDLFILTDTESELTVPTHKYYIKRSWNALSISFSLSLLHSSEVLHSSSSQGKSVRRYTHHTNSLITAHTIWIKPFVTRDMHG